MSADAALLDFLAGFAGALTAPSLVGLVLVASLAIGRPGLARAVAAALGVAHGGLEWVLELRPVEAVPLLLGSLAAAALVVELVLQVLLPTVRLARRALQALLGLLADRG
jgi:hypothetical protein